MGRRHQNKVIQTQKKKWRNETAITSTNMHNISSKNKQTVNSCKTHKTYESQTLVYSSYKDSSTILSINSTVGQMLYHQVYF